MQSDAARNGALYGAQAALLCGGDEKSELQILNYPPGEACVRAEKKLFLHLLRRPQVRSG